MTSGFSNCRALAIRLDTIFKTLKSRMQQHKQYQFGLRTLVSCIRVACTKRLNSELSDSTDETILYDSITQIWLPRLDIADRNIFTSIIGHYFSTVSDLPKHDMDLETCVREFASAEGLGHILVKKVLQLNELLESSRATIVLGKPGSFKTATWKLLAKVKNHLASKSLNQRSITTSVINPKAFQSEDLFGGFTTLSEDDQKWSNGILHDLIVKFATDSKRIHWLVLDGPLDPTWSESLNTALDDSRILSVGNGQRVPIPLNVRIIFETDSVTRTSVRYI